MQNGTWESYSGSASWILAGLLLGLALLLVFLGRRLHRRLSVASPGRFVRTAIVLAWLLSGFSFLTAVVTYVEALKAQNGDFSAPANPISPVTAVCGLVTFVTILFLTRKDGIKTAWISAATGALAGPMIFELPFDLIVAGRTYPPSPPVQYTLLFFLPLFAVEISSFAMLSFSPAMKLSRYTLFALAGMLFVFAIWAATGFGYPLTALPIAFNATSKILAFAAAVTLFLPPAAHVSRETT